MDEQDRKKLVRNRVAIVESLIVEDVRAFLIEREVFTSDQFEQITRQTTRRHRAEKLLDRLSTRGPEAFQEFRKALKQCNYSFLDSLLKKGGLEGKPQHTERQKTIPESLPNSLKSLTEENAKLKAELKTLRAENAQKQKNIDSLKRQNDSRVLKEHVQNEKTKKVQEELKTYKEKNPEKPQVIKGTGVVTSSMKDGSKRALQRTQTMYAVGSPGQVSPDSTRCNTAPGRGQKPESKPVTKTIIVPSWNEVSKENKTVPHSTKPVVRVGGTSTVSPKGTNTSPHPPTFARGATEETSPRQVRNRATLKNTLTTPTQVGKDKTQKQETGHNKLSTTSPAGQQFSATRLSPHRPPTGSSGYRSESRSTTRTQDTDEISEDTRSRTSERQGLLSRRDKASPNRVSTGRSSGSSGRHSTTKVKIKVPSPDLRGPISIEYEIANESQSVDSDSTES
ncbi:DNA-directed RNA polymerase III subunit RPC4 [Branchiostoma belcheri]|nr:DNA-directed RNA polymerase III subunit RPC4 [Branchiostoma belcheri]